jgi:hypothetical protein
MRVNRPRAGRPTVLVAIVAVLGVVWLPSEHVHSFTGEGEHADVIHRHIAPHHGHEPGAAIDHEDGDARYLSSPFTPQKLSSPTAPASHVTSVDLVALETASLPGWALTSLHVRVHDPPWISSPGLRGPPTLLV